MSFTIKCDNGDLMTTIAGSYAIISGIEKCAQDIAESLLNNYDPEIELYYNGSELYKVGDDPTILDTIGAEELIEVAVADAMERLKDLQDNDLYIDEDESIDEIRRLDVDKVGYFSWRFFLYVITESEEFIPANYDITLSQQLPASLADDFSKFIPPYVASVQPFK